MEFEYLGASDCHTHCKHSHDTDYEPTVMLNKAIALGAQYYAFTDHDDRDYLYTLPQYGETQQLNVQKHIDEILHLQKLYADRIYVGLGIECSYSPYAEDDYLTDLSLTDQWDIVLNSVHTVGGHDVYFAEYFKTFDKNAAYRNYLHTVLDSLDVKYHYDVVGHIGYVTRKAPFGDKNAITYGEFGDIIDAILRSIVSKGVSLEINTHTGCKGLGGNFIPDESIIDRYIELGGCDFTFGSDAHQDVRVLDKYGVVRDMLLAKGIRYLNCYKKCVKTPIKIN